jgi:hypothetical protein
MCSMCSLIDPLRRTLVITTMRSSRRQVDDASVRARAAVHHPRSSQPLSQRYRSARRFESILLQGLTTSQTSQTNQRWTSSVSISKRRQVSCPPRIVLRARDRIEQLQLTATTIPLHIRSNFDITHLDHYRSLLSTKKSRRSRPCSRHCPPEMKSCIRGSRSSRLIASS